MEKSRIFSAILFLTTAIFNTGCIGRFFVDERPPSSVNYDEYQSAEQGGNLDIECSDERSIKKSNCDRGTISEEDLKSTSSIGGEHILQSIRGKVIHIRERPNGFIFAEYPNKVIILEMFGKNCPHCVNELPTLKRIRNRYRGRLEIIAIQAQDRMDRATARNYINSNQIRYPIIEGDDATNLQYFIQKTYGWRGILPYMLVIRNGVTEFSYSGEVDYEELKRDINSLMR